MNSHYKNIIFTNHALERMQKRSISRNKIWQVINNPDKVISKVSENKKIHEWNFVGNSSNTSTTKKYLRKINNRKYQVIATYLKKERCYLVISTWVRGEEDKPNLVWNLITLPFKMFWWLIKITAKFLTK